MAATHARALRSSPAAIYLACARSANAGRRCPRERGGPGPRLVHTPSEPSDSQRSPTVSRSRSWQARSCRNKPEWRTLITMRSVRQPVIERPCPTEPPAAARCARVYRATTPAMLAGGTAVQDARSAFQGRLLPIRCPRLGIRGRSMAERASDLGWSTVCPIRTRPSCKTASRTWPWRPAGHGEAMNRRLNLGILSPTLLVITGGGAGRFGARAVWGALDQVAFTLSMGK